MIFPAILALSLSTASGSLCGNFRRDHYLSKKDYDEEFAKAPKEGGRIQLISKADAQLDAAQPFTVDTGAFSLKLDPSLVDPDAPKSPVSDDVEFLLVWVVDGQSSLIIDAGDPCLMKISACPRNFRAFQLA